MKKPKKFLFLLILAASVCILIGGKVFSQTTLATLEGKITDEEGSALPGATITVRNIDTGYENSSASRKDGGYIISGIQPGRYECEVTLSGFVTQIRKGITFAVGARLKIDFTLAVTALEEEVTVTAEAPMVEVSKSEISSVVDRQKIETLPLLDRNFSTLTITKAGVLSAMAYGSLQMRSNAMPGGMEEIMVDGVSDEKVIQNTPRPSLPADAIQEFRILTNQFAAEFGNTSGMVRTAITRSGTNELRGRLSYFYRDEMLDTPNYFVNHSEYQGEKLSKDEYEIPPYKHNNVGGFIGGPIKKDKAHFFLSYEGKFRETYSTITSPLVPRESVPQPDNLNQALVKLDYKPGEKHALAFRYSLNHTSRDNYFVGGLATKERAATWVEPNHEFQLNWTWFLSDNSMNEFRALLVKNYSHIDPLPELVDQYSIFRPSGYFGKHQAITQHNFADRYQVLDNLSIFLGNHSLKMGFDFQYVPSGADIFDSYKPGAFSFRTDEPFDANDPSTYPRYFTYTEGETDFKVDGYQAAVFIQDSWKIHPRLTLNYGLRYNYFDFGGLDLKTWDLSNLNIRSAFSWDPVGDGKTSIRGGIGTYTANVMMNVAKNAVFYNKVTTRRIEYPGYPDPFQPNPFVAAIPSTGKPTRYLIEPVPNPVSLQMTLGILREILTNVSAGFDLVWTKGYNLITYKNENPIIVGTSYLRPDMTKGDLWSLTNEGKSDYKALYVTLNKRYSHGWALEVAYTLGKSMGNTETQDTPWTYEADCWDRAWGRKNNDARHKLTITGVLDIPFGFQVSSLLFYQSAYPWNAVYTTDVNLDGLGSDYVDQNRNSREGYDSFIINVRISKFISISRFRFQLLGEIFNVTNRANFTSVYSYYGRPLFGLPIQADDPRLIQLGLRLDF